jgi:predicted phosphoribosyltransferase
MLLVVLVAMVERSLILLEERVQRIQQQSFRNLKRRIAKGKLMPQQHEQQQRQLLLVDLVALLRQMEMAVKLLRQSQLGKEQSLTGHLLG